MKPLDRAHPADDRLIALYFGDGGAGADEERAVRQHLHGCEPCTWRFTELTAPLERLRQDAASEADEVFTSARLDAQRARVLHRIQEGAAEARVIPFPAARAVADRSVVRRPMARWVATAAAAGLLIGVVAGRFIDMGATPGRSMSQVPTIGAAKAVGGLPEAVMASPVSAPMEGDEAFLRELSHAVSRQRIAELAVLDEMTPHGRPETVLARAIW